ncbi:hypothetical protein EGC79_17200 [Shewanella vesiculosa]|nr:hypothetical protein EGC79_17200 [Shewanella vesiculosa]
MREPDMAFLAHLTYMDIGNVIMMSGTSLTMCFKVFRHPVYQMPARFRGGMSFFSIHATTTFVNPFTSDSHRKR